MTHAPSQRRDGLESEDESATAPVDGGPSGIEQPEASFRLLVDGVTDYAIFMLDPQGRIATWNRGAERISGYSEQEVLGRPFSMFYPPEERGGGGPQRELEVAVERGRYRGLGQRVRKDGSRYWAHIVLTSVRDRDGRLRGFAKVTRDVTEQRAAEEALRQSEERFRLLVASVRDYAIFMLDPQGRVATWNLGAERMKGYRADEIIGQHFSIFYPEEARRVGHPEAELRQALREGRYQEEGWRRRKDGSQFFAHVTITSVRGPTGNLLGFAKVTRDVTERRAAEEALRGLAAELEEKVRERTAELEDANRDLEAFSYSVSHDLRAPLRALDGFSKVLLDQTADRLEPVHRNYLGRIRSAAQRMSQLIDDMLMFSRLSRASIEPSPVDLTAMAREIAHELGEAEPGRHIQFAAQQGLTITADPRLLRVLMENLLGNAWKFTRRRAHPRVEVGALWRDGETVYYVRDNGAGFDPRYADKLFMPFQRLHSSREFEGTGVGLATACRVVKRHGGRLWAEAAPDQGATFYMTFPAERREPDAA